MERIMSAFELEPSWKKVLNDELKKAVHVSIRGFC